MMKIAFLSRYQKTTERGAEVFVKELALRISKKHQVDILTGSSADSLKEVLGGKYDVVIPINGRLQSLKMSLGRLVSKYKLLISGHSGKGWDDILNVALAKPDVFVALTNDMANWAKKWAWGSKVVKIPNGIDLEKFSPQGERIKINLPKPIIISVGALVWYKYHDKVIKAVSKLKKGSLLIVGEGEDRIKLQNLGERLLGSRFKILNFKYEDMPKVYRSCDLFTLASWDREAFGIVYLEAMASGLPIIAPNDLSRKEIVGDGGLLVNVRDEIEYCNVIKLTLETEWGNKPRQQSEKFSWDIITDKYEKLILDLR